ncbi:MAG: DUF92 domain-containing protein [Chloroflexi bacterium]|nr:DUF92 domain-containing protein [Chloroflexota bacterium]
MTSVVLAAGVGLFWGILAYRLRFLSLSSAALLVFVAVIFIPSRWPLFVVLLAFVYSAGLLSAYRESEKGFMNEIVADVGPRGFWQAISNGGLASILGMAHIFYPDDRLLAAFLGAAAAVTADTWATELGVLSPTPPRMISTWRVAAPGTSGAVSALGTAMVILGSLFIGLTALSSLWAESLLQGQAAPWWTLPVCMVGGTVGAFVDSLIGATIQASFYCDRCRKITEKALHGCGQVTRLVGGMRWLGNDATNFLSSVSGAVIALAIQAILAG